MPRPSPRAVVGALLLVAPIALLARRAWELTFLCDDAYISFRYVRNLIEGRGLVFNPGEYVEGYTNFLWVLELAAVWALTGISPEQSAHVLSAIATAGTVAGTAWLAARTPLAERWLVVFASLVLLCTDRNVAVWATSGLETRQFTMLVLLGLVALTARGARAAAIGSVLLGGAALTRPEGQLVFGVAAGLRALDEARGALGGGTARDRALRVGALVAPFAAIVGGHLLWRRWYYGDWLPNTYYAKHVRPWPEMGATYLLGVTIETALYLLVPLAILGTVTRVRRSGRIVYAAGLVGIVLHGWFVLQVGGDHFEWRMLDWWWPFLFVAAAEGTVAAFERLRRPVLVHAGAAAAVAVVVVYGSVFEVVHDRLVADQFARGYPALHPKPTPKDAPELWRLGLGPLVPSYDEALQTCIDQGVAIRHWKHRDFWERQREAYAPYLSQRQTLGLPADAVAARGAVGIMPYHLPDLVVVDILGLTDAVVARHRAPPNEERHMAHDRRPPPGYLAERGVNMNVGPHFHRLGQALARYPAALRLERGYLAFATRDPEWAATAFGERLSYRRLDHRVAANRVKVDDATLRGRVLLGTFEEALDGWEVTGEAFLTVRRGGAKENRTISGHEGHGLLDSYDPEQRDRLVGEARSPAFAIAEGDHLALLVGGGKGERVGVALEIDGERVQTWRGKDNEALRFEFVDLTRWAGRTARVVAFDHERGRWGHVLLDHVVVLEPVDRRSASRDR